MPGMVSPESELVRSGHVAFWNFEIKQILTSRVLKISSSRNQWLYFKISKEIIALIGISFLRNRRNTELRNTFWLARRGHGSRKTYEPMMGVKPTAMGPQWTLDQASDHSLRLRGICLSSWKKSQSHSNCSVSGSVAALIYLATSSEVTGVLKLLVALLTSSASWPLKLRVSSPVLLVFTPSTIGVLIFGSQNVSTRLKFWKILLRLQDRVGQVQIDSVLRSDFRDKQWLSRCSMKIQLRRY